MCGGAHSLSWDYLPGVPQGEEAEARVSWRQKPIGSLVSKYILKASSPIAPAHEDVEAEKQDLNTDGMAPLPSIIPYKEPIAAFETPVLARQITRTSQRTIAAPSGPPQRLPSASMTPSNTTVNSSSVPRQPLYLRILAPVRALLHPVTMALIVSLPIALVNPLKALFVDISATGGPDFTGPDGRPPLAFIIDTGMFVFPVCHDTKY